MINRARRWFRHRLPEAAAAMLAERESFRAKSEGTVPSRDLVRLCVMSKHLIDPGNYPGPIHCTAHPEGHPCVTALYERIPDTTAIADESDD